MVRKIGVGGLLVKQSGRLIFGPAAQGAPSQFGFSSRDVWPEVFLKGVHGLDVQSSVETMERACHMSSYCGWLQNLEIGPRSKN